MRIPNAKVLELMNDFRLLHCESTVRYLEKNIIRAKETFFNSYKHRINITNI